VVEHPAQDVPYGNAVLAALLEASEDSIIVQDPGGRVLVWNGATERLTGWPAADVVGQPIPDLLVADITGLRERILAGERLERWETTLRRRDGLTVPVSLTSSALAGEGGVASHLVTVTRELTEQQLTQEALAEAAARLSEAQQLARIGLWIWDTISDSVQLSDELYNICAIDPLDFDGTLDDYLTSVHPDRRADVRTAMHAAVAAGERFTVEYPIVRPSGEERWVQTRGDPVLSEAGQVLGLRGICQDLTERRAAEETLRLSVERLEEADRLKDEFLAVVSHELRTPLAAIVGFSYALRHGDDPDERSEIATRVAANAEEMRRMVDRLLDFSRLQAGRVEVDPVDVVLRESVERICLNLGAVVGEHSVAVEVSGDIRAMADEDGLTRIIGNLVTNAVKFSPAGTTISIDAEQDGAWVTVSVRDEGIGIPSELQARVFERFFQGREQPVGRRGTGVGLAIAHRYAELHGGRIWLESTENVGTTFFFTLPAAAPPTG
jgi:PAS domain S-box-containing protein